MAPRNTSSRARLVVASLSACVAVTHAARHLEASAPCYIVDSYYPKRTCRTSDDPTECRLAPQSFASKDGCCNSFGADGCSPEGEVECFVAGSRYPTTECTKTNVCLPHTSWSTMEECCEPSNAFTHGCGYQYSKGFEAAEVEASCWVASTYYPVRECYEIFDAGVCQQGWGTWRTYQACCAPNAAHADGCGFAA